MKLATAWGADAPSRERAISPTEVCRTASHVLPCASAAGGGAGESPAAGLLLPPMSETATPIPTITAARAPIVHARRPARVRPVSAVISTSFQRTSLWAKTAPNTQSVSRSDHVLETRPAPRVEEWQP